MNYEEALQQYYRNMDVGNWPETLEVNRIYKGDCLEGIQRIPSNSVRLIVADPPYHQGLTHNGQRGSFVDLSVCKPFFKQLFQEYKRVLTNDGEVYFFTDWRGYAFYYPLFDAVLGARNLVVWDKQSGAGNFFTFNHELILFHCVSPQTNKKGANVWRSPGFPAGAERTNGKKVHPTQKTIEIIEKIVLEGSQPGDLVLDTFGGSGTTAVVCRKHNRSFILFELDEENYDQADKRQQLPVQKILL